MRATIVIPSYWGRHSEEPHNLADAVYDHPTPLDMTGTLERALESIAVLSNRDFNVVVIAVATNPEIQGKVEAKVQSMLAPFKSYYPVTLVSHSFEKFVRERLAGKNVSERAIDMVSLTGYSNIRNMCLIAAELAGSEVAVLFDDDEVYEDPGYLDKVFENIGRKRQGQFAGALAGYYMRPEGGYLLPPPEDWWMAEWPMVEAMNEAFAIIAEEPRLEKTPFVFGGNMCVHRDVFRIVPFDPNVRRGEDIDYLVNCKNFGVDFLLDSQLSIMHLPPGTHVPSWQHFRENIFRFMYAREKFAAQKPVKGLRMVKIEELDPYPGRCMGENLEDLIFKTSVLMGMHYMKEGEEVGFRESVRNIHIARFESRPTFDAFSWYLQCQKSWLELMSAIAEDEMLSGRMLDGMKT